VGSLDHICLDGKVIGDELRRVRLIGKDATDFGRGEKDVLGPFFREEAEDSSLTGEVQFGVCARDGRAAVLSFEPIQDRRSGEPPMSRNVNPGTARRERLVVRFQNNIAMRLIPI
jgi:hypothetical protein